MTVGFYHESAGGQESGGIAVFVREMAIELSNHHETVLYTKECDLVPALAASSVEVKQIPSTRLDKYTGRALTRATPLNTQNVSKLQMFYAARRNGYIEHIDANIDVLLTSQWIDDILMSNATETPTVYEFHGCSNIGIATWARKRFANSEYKLVNSHHTANRVRNQLGISVDEVVYPGVDIDRYNPSVEPAFEHDQPVVLYVGRVTEQKGTFDLLRAFTPLAETAQLHIVGRGNYEKAKDIARELGISEAVTFDGVVPEESLPGYYTASDIYCLPSYYEGLGMGNLEAMASGTAVATTNVGGIPEYATHEQSALLSLPGAVDQLRSNLERLVAEPELRDRLGREGRSVAEFFAWERQADTLASFCERVVEQETVREVTPPSA